MPSKYRPQIFGWFDDLAKIASYKYESHNDRLIYANNNYCAFIRKTFNAQIFYICFYFVGSIGMIILVVGCLLLTFGFNDYRDLMLVAYLMQVVIMLLMMVKVRVC